MKLVLELLCWCLEAVVSLAKMMLHLYHGLNSHNQKSHTFTRVTRKENVNGVVKVKTARNGFSFIEKNG